jgi:Uma2 family endonuclease
MDAESGRMTADDLYRYPECDRSELVRGMLRVSEPPSGYHGQVATRLAARLDAYVEARRLGTVLVEAGFILARGPDTVRGPDVSFVSAERLDPERVPSEFLSLAPDLAVEISSPKDGAWDLAEKVADYLAAGARLVWVVEPRNGTVTVHRADGSIQGLGPADSLDGEDVIPGFSCPLAQLLPRSA